ncbi:hypothetical protein ABT160_02615 [Streptomyces sp. NPDC001941]|uniref:hypothetical protein n=1 Tax=Streptomyces sp. NPDC001941 TaxID=3154659 RepID=UPI00332209E4
MTSLAAAGSPFGALGSGGLALVVVVFLILGVRGKGRVKLTASPAAYIGFIAATAASAAGKTWGKPEQVIGQGLSGLGVGQSGGPFGDVGLGAVALLLLAIYLTMALTSASAAAIGVIAGVVWPATGDSTLWSIPCALAEAALGMLGS